MTHGYSSDSIEAAMFYPLTGSGAPVTTPVFVGQVYLDTTAKREYKAYGTASSADWLKVPVFYSGTGTVTSGGGDITITLPWDWTNGYLMIHLSDTTTEYASTDLNYYIMETSYIALTAAGYTSQQIILHNRDGASHGNDAKTVNRPGLPKSATSTTFVLDDGGTTVYFKYFVWA